MEECTALYESLKVAHQNLKDTVDTYLMWGGIVLSSILSWNAWITLRNISQAKEIAVNTAEDRLIIQRFNESVQSLKEDNSKLEDALKDLAREVHSLNVKLAGYGILKK